MLALHGPVQAADPGYVVTDADRKLDCRRLTGRITVRLMELRAERSDAGGAGSGVGQAIQGATNSAAAVMFGKSSTYLADRPQRLGRDYAQLKAYNGLLAEKACAVFDIDAELGKPTDAPQPRPIRAAPATSK